MRKIASVFLLLAGMTLSGAVLAQDTAAHQADAKTREHVSSSEHATKKVIHHKKTYKTRHHRKVRKTEVKKTEIKTEANGT